MLRQGPDLATGLLLRSSALNAARNGLLARMHGEPLLELNGGVLDAEARAQLLGGYGEERVFAARAGSHQVHGERNVSGAHAPDVEVVHLDDAVELTQHGTHLLRIDSR